MEDKKLMLGNEAVARGIYEAGCRFVSSYPGTPSTEITEYAALYNELHAEWAPNEKVAVEAAFGAATAGARAFSGMKHVGLNVAADPVFTASYIGVNGGLVIAVADDMGMHSSQNEQDSRHYALASKLPMLEPADSQECLDFTRRAFALSEEFDTPVLLRLSTRIAHSRGLVAEGQRQETPLRAYTKDIMKNVMMPAMARRRHVVVEERTKKLEALAETADFNKTEYFDRSIGIIASGIAYQYAREALGDKASYLKLGMVNPMPEKLIKDFAAGVDRLYIIEELDDFIETYCLKIGVKCEGKALFSPLGEYTAGMIRERILGVKQPVTQALGDIPARPPALCPGCPHRGLFYTIKKLGLTVSGDIGCYTLGATAPLQAMDLCLCMGASISALHGMNTVRGEEFSKKSVAVIGDSTFMHSGITGLLNIVYNQSESTVLILDNSITGMTGHQQNPATGLTLQNKPAPALDIENLCRAIGVKRVRVVDPYALEELEQALREELAADEPSVIIAKRPCVLLKSVTKGKPYTIDKEKCRRCGACMRIGCPALSAPGDGMEINSALCVGCGLCQKLCKFGAISRGEE